jgi:hypothetical protein
MTVRRFALVAAAALSALPAVGLYVSACPFCSSSGQTLSSEVAQADLIVLGKMGNVRFDPNDPTRGTTDLSIETVVKPNDFLSGKTVLQIPRPIKDGGDVKFLVFGSLYPRPELLPAATVGSAAVLANPALSLLDPYRGEVVKGDSKLPEYLKGAIEVRQKDPVARLRYFFDYLDAPEVVIGTDAMTEFGNADYKDVRTVAATLPANKLLKWLTDPNTPASRFGLYGLLLGHCGKKTDAAAVRALLDEKDRVYSSGLDGVLAAYILLDADAGWTYLTDLLKDPKSEFPVRYAGLKVLRFFNDYRPDVVGKDQILEGMRHLVGQPDMADLPIEDLRKWGAWDQAEYVLSFGTRDSHRKIPIVRRAILRYALSAPPGTPKAKELVDRARADDPDRVKQVEDLLRDEQPKPPAAAQKPAGGPGGS